MNFTFAGISESSRGQTATENAMSQNGLPADRDSKMTATKCEEHRAQSLTEACAAVAAVQMKRTRILPEIYALWCCHRCSTQSFSAT